MDLTERQAERFWAKVSIPRDVITGCWVWTAARNSHGYGNLRLRGDYVGAHRVSWEALNGRPAKGRFLLHSCDNRWCVNPAHLRPGSHAENMRDMMGRNRVSRGAAHMAALKETAVRGAMKHNAKLTNAKVRRIRRQLSDGSTQRAIAREYGVNAATIGALARGITWKHVT